MLVAFEAGIASRVQITVISAGGFASEDPSESTRSMWLDANPTWRLLTLA